MIKATLAMLAVLTLVGPAYAQNRAAFCARWHNVCRTTCPPTTPTAVCHATCDDRRAGCLATGCYRFNVPGPRCEGDQTVPPGPRR